MCIRDSFSGYYLIELQKQFHDKLFLKYIDTLVDGRYIERQHENTNIKGSTNQSVYRIIDEIPVKENKTRASKKWSLNVSSENEIYMSGIPKKNELKILCNELVKVKIQKTFR